MLICPQCKFENPNTNKFCQNCGASLTHKVCPECNADVPLNAQTCHNCGAECGTIWWAIIAKVENFVIGEADFDNIEKQRQDEPESSLFALDGIHEACPENVDSESISPVGDGKQLLQPESGGQVMKPEEELESENVPTLPTPPVSVSTSASSSFPEGSYLDLQQRYKLLELLPNLEEMPANTQWCVRVLDCQPYQISLLEAMATNQYQELATSSQSAVSLPYLAKAYVALQPYTNQGIPPIHDAWQQGDIQVVLLEDRDRWLYLLDLWRDDKTSSLQLVNYLYQMTRLWALLEPFNCRQSLLELPNLRLDEDQALALQMLYVEPLKNTPATPLTNTTSGEDFSIQTLGRVWQKLFKESQRTQFGSLLELLGDLEIGNIQTLLELQSRLQAIASELQTPSSTNKPNMTSAANQDHDSPPILQLNEQEEDTATKLIDDLPTVVLPMQLISLEHAGLTDVGRQRHHNEDYFGIDTKIAKLELPNTRNLQARALYILCDGMGGHAGGEVASALAVNTVRQYFKTNWIASELPTEDQIREAIRQANQAIYDVNQQDARSGIGRMGTTLIMLLIQNTQAAVAHVGDSRLYCVTRKRGLEQLTVDHEVGQREISRGVEPNVAYARPDAYQLTQALGPRDENFIIPDVKFFEISEDSLFVLASDGLSDNDLLETNWQNHLLPLLSSGVNLEDGIRDLINVANDYNGHDNITVVLVRAKVRPALESQKEIVTG
ncbi:serine/threonine phosphatase [Chlorogloeopsis fritschii PCC 9212]|uniref:serine/threonine phosphatase n=1 Tax=Chlorogloeopsis fritschii TaxID=1124 RepID=UPI00031BFF89|nr:serine/threonine phosphatase [Chlorogloeopsis fritschii]